MIKNIRWLLICLFPAAGVAQVELDQLTAPTSPASAITGIQPATVLAPKSYQALETALYGNFVSDGNVAIPKDVAIEFTPYWTKNHGLTLKEYLYPDFIDAFLRNSSFSLASTQNFVLGDSSKTNGLGFGYRTTFFFPLEEDKKAVNAFTDSLRLRTTLESNITAEAMGVIYNGTDTTKAALLQAIQQKVAAVILKLNYVKDQDAADAKVKAINKEAYETLPDLDMSHPEVFLNAYFALIEKHLQLNAVFADFKSYLKIRHGLAVDLAYANFTSFPTNDFEFSYVPKQAFWITPSFRWTDGKRALKALLVYRYEWYQPEYYRNFFPTASVFRNNHDFGAAVTGEFSKCSIQLEVIGRSSNTLTPAATDAEGNTLYSLKQRNDLQYLLTLNYSVTDAITLTYTIGNKFDPLLASQSTLVSMLTLNLGFGSPITEELGTKR